MVKPVSIIPFSWSICGRPLILLIINMKLHDPPSPPTLSGVSCRSDGAPCDPPRGTGTLGTCPPSANLSPPSLKVKASTSESPGLGAGPASYGHLFVITGSIWDYTFYKWCLLVLITGCYRADRVGGARWDSDVHMHFHAVMMAR